jgi:hypothetical protein
MKMAVSLLNSCLVEIHLSFPAYTPDLVYERRSRYCVLNTSLGSS